MGEGGVVGTLPGEAEADVTDVSARLDTLEVVGAVVERVDVPAELGGLGRPLLVRPDPDLAVAADLRERQGAVLAFVLVAVVEGNFERSEGAVLEDGGRGGKAEGRVVVRCVVAAAVDAAEVEFVAFVGVGSADFAAAAPAVVLAGE